MAILSNVKKKIVLNAGHFIPGDSGYICEKCGLSNGGTVTEAEQVIEIRNILLMMLKDNLFDVTSIPDDRNLAKSIEIANIAAPTLNDGLCIDIHLNSNKDTNMRGVSIYSGTSPVSAQISRVLSANIAKTAQIPDLGYKPHTEAFVGSLGWIMKTKAWAVVIECAFLTNENDRALILANPNGKTLIAKGILNGIMELYGITQIERTEPAKEPDLNTLQKIINQLSAILVELRLLISKKLGRGKF